MIDLEIFTPQLVALGVIDTYTSLLWERRYFEAGAFEIQMPATATSIALAIKNNIIVKPDSSESGVILRRELKNTEAGAVIIVSGRFLSFLLHGHIVQQEITLKGNVETTMRSLVTSTVLNSATTDYIPNLQLGELNAFADTMSNYCNYPDLFDYLVAVANASGVAFRVRFDTTERVLYFECVKGADRSIEQSDNPQIIFAEDYDNLYTCEYEDDSTSEINSAIVRYKGDKGEVIVDYNPQNLSGTDKKTVSVTGQAVLANGVLDVDATRESLQSIAKKALVSVATNFTASVKIDTTPAYKTDYDLGDIVTIQHNAWGITTSERITVITETLNEVVPTFGNPAPTIADILKNKI